MAEELQDRKTNVTAQEMAVAMHHAWCRYFGAPPAAKSIMVLLAQWALETGRGKSMHNYNVGNVKARPGGDFDWQFYACNEKLSTKSAKQMQQAAPTTAKITRDNGDGTCWIWFYPNHPGCCFRAFKTLDDGVFDHLLLLVNHPKYKEAWPAVLAGAPQEFSKRLRAGGYYTAPEATYTAGVVRLFKEFSESIVLPEPPLLTPAEVKRVKAGVAMSLHKMANDMSSALRREPDDDTK